MITVTEAVVLANPDVTEKSVYLLCKLALSGNYGGANTHGDTLSFAGLSDFASDQIPNWVDIFEQPPSGTQPSWYSGVYCPGTTRDNGVVSFGLAGTEYTEGLAYSGALASATLYALACFPKFV